MEYTNKEKEILSIIEKTDFKNLGKKDLLSYASKLDELRPEVAIEALKNYPEFAGLVKSSLGEYKGILDKIVESNDSSSEHVYNIIDSSIVNDENSRKKFYEFADKIRSDCSKLLDSQDVSVEDKKTICDKELEILKMLGEKDSEIRESEMEKVRIADRKDSENKLFNWKTIAAASLVVFSVVGLGASVLGGDFDLDLPHKS